MVTDPANRTSSDIGRETIPRPATPIGIASNKPLSTPGHGPNRYNHIDFTKSTNFRALVVAVPGRPEERPCRRDRGLRA